MHRPSGLLRRFVSTISIAATVVMPYAAFVPSAHAADVLPLESFGTGSSVNDILGWNEEGNDDDSSTLAKSFEASGNESVSPNGGRFARIGEDEWICREVNAAGYNTLRLSYYWRGDANADDSSDDGIVEYKAGSGNCDVTGWSSLQNHDLRTDSTWSTQSAFDLADALDDTVFRLRFRSSVDDDSDHFRVDGVLVTGDVILYPDLVAVKTNNTGTDAVAPDGTFRWTIRVENIGEGTATFTNNEDILRDNMPAGDDFGDYSGVTLVTSGVTGSVDCDLNDGSQNDNEDLTCDANGTVMFPAGSYFEVSVLANLNPSASGTITNPRASGICRADPDNEVVENIGGNNNCGNSLGVVIDLCSNLGGFQEIMPEGYEDLDEDGVCTAIPTPTPSPSATPTPTPTPSGSPTPTPTPTGTLLVQKVIAGEAPEGTNVASFSFSVNSTTYGFQEGGTSVVLPAGTYSVVENDNPDYIFTNGYSGSCFESTVTIAADQTTTCTITNTFSLPPPTPTPTLTPTPTPTATIIVVKETVGGYGTFHFTGLGGEEGFDLTTTASGSDSEEFTVVVPASGSGSFTITEEIPEGWQLGISCLYDGEEAGYEVQNGVTVYLDANDDVTCTFTNTLPATPTPTPTPSGSPTPTPNPCDEGYEWNGEECVPSATPTPTPEPCGGEEQQPCESPSPTPEPEEGGGGGGGSSRATLIVEKVIVFGEDASVSFSDFSFWLDGELHQFEEDGSNEFNLRSGDYMVTEDYTSGFTVGYSGDCDENGNLSMIGDETYVCVVTNTLGVGGFNPGSEVPAPTPTPTPTPTPGGGTDGGNGDGTAPDDGTLGGIGGESPSPSASPSAEENLAAAAIGSLADWPVCVPGGIGWIVVNLGLYILALLWLQRGDWKKAFVILAILAAVLTWLAGECGNNPAWISVALGVVSLLWLRIRGRSAN